MPDSLFYPRSVAVIGASSNPRKVGYSVLNNILSAGYNGEVCPVNPKPGKILGLDSFSSVSEIKKDIDLAVIAVPAPLVPGIIRDCIKKGVGTAVIISAGFKEAGSEGIVLEQEIKSLAGESGIRILGPNCLGVINTANSLNATFAAGMLPRGRLAFFSQSGALGIAILDWAIGNKLGFSKFISLGNKADLNEADFIEYFVNDPETDIILGYIEDVVEGRKFLEIAKSATKVKPIILVKSGGTQAGARAASSHTGALAGSESAFNAAFRQTGIIRAAGIEDLFETAMAFSSHKLPQGNSLLIVTNAGGPGIIAADAAEKLGISLPSLSKPNIDRLRKVLPKHASFYNPVDILGDATSERYASVLENVLGDPNINGCLVILTPQAMVDVEATARSVIDLSEGTDKPVITCFMGEERVRSSVQFLKSRSISSFSYPEPAVKAFRRLSDYYAWVQKAEEYPGIEDAGRPAVEKIMEQAYKDKRFQFAEDGSREVLSHYGFEFPPKLLSVTPEGAASAASRIGFPVVMKISSPDILHKTDIGGVKTGINSKKEAREAFTGITVNAMRFMPSAFIRGVTVYKMVPKGREVILGITYDRTFGHMIMFGLGGIYVEVLRDVSFRIVPVSRSDAGEMVEEIRTFPLLKGARGEKPADIDSIIDCIMRLSRIASDFPMIQELDINPLVVYEKGAIALDARIIISQDNKEEDK